MKEPWQKATVFSFPHIPGHPFGPCVLMGTSHVVGTPEVAQAEALLSWNPLLVGGVR